MNKMERPVNLRVEQEPYPHLRDNKGCILARDYQHVEKLNYILYCVKQAEKLNIGNNTNG